MDRELREQQLEIAAFMRKKMPGFQNAGTVHSSAAGILAALSVKNHILPREIPYDMLRPELETSGFIIE